MIVKLKECYFNNVDEPVNEDDIITICMWDILTMHVLHGILCIFADI